MYKEGLEIITAATRRNPPEGVNASDEITKLPEQHYGKNRG